MAVAEAQLPIAHYEIERALGRGAIGTVYLARDTRIGRRVALKTIQLAERHFEDSTAAQEFFLRLQREAEVGGALLHPNIVTLYEAGYHDGRVSYLAMELVEGETLFDLMKRHRPGPVPVGITLRIALDVLRGLAHAHAKQITHRDIKPANILIAGDGNAKIADFGIARPEHSSMTVAGSLVGTPNYMSPEQVTGSTISPRSDIFSLGVVLHEMLTATKPFAATEIPAILHNILREDAPRASDINPSVPRPVSDLVARLLAKDPAARPSADEVFSEVERLLRPTAPQPAPGQVERRTATLAIGLTIALAAIPIFFIASRVDSTPTVTIPAAQLAEFEEKRRALEAADALLNDGKYEESLLAYQAYLDRYPHSLAAEEGRDRAAQAIADTTVTPARKRASPKEEDISPRELLRRIRRVFKR
jgi:serine/threonine-protein kinase